MRNRLIGCLVVLLVALCTAGVGIKQVEAVYYSLENLGEIHRDAIIALPEISEYCYENNSYFFSNNERGDILLLTRCGGASGAYHLYLYSEGVWTDASPGMGVNYQNIAMNNLGHVAFQTGGGIYVFDGSQLNLVITKNMLLDGDDFGYRGIDINDYDEIAFTGGNENGNYWWNNMYVYKNQTITKLTHTTYVNIYQKPKINNLGEVACTHNWGAWSGGGRTDVLVYNGTSVTNITNFPPGKHANIWSYNNAGELLYREPSMGTYIYDGIGTREVTRDGASFDLVRNMNDNGLMISAFYEQLLCDGFTCETILTDFAPENFINSSYGESPAIDNAERITVSTGVLISETYTGTAQPFAINSLSVSQIYENSAAISWGTDIPASTRVEFGTTYALGDYSSLDPSATISHSVMLDGLQPYTKYYFRAISVDELGNETISSVKTFTTKDLTPPVTVSNITGSAGLNGWYISDAVVNLNSTDSASGVKEVRYSINSGYEYKVQGDSVSLNIASEGINYISFYAIDTAGNIETTNTIQVNIDKTSPAQPINISPADNEKDVPFSQTNLIASTFSDSNEQLDSQWEVCTASDCTVPEFDILGGAVDTITVSGLNPKQTYYWRVKYQDVAGHWSAWSNITSFRTAK